EASDGIEGLKLLISEQDVDLVLCDLEMPGLDGEKLLQIKEAQLADREIPILFLTASTDLERRVRLLESGASDTITKPFHPADLVARLRLHLKLKLLQDELREKNEVLKGMSTTDHLTKLRTRRYLAEVLAVECLRSKRYKSPLSVVMADLDYFKRINDTYGHASGDEVLKGTADVLRESLRATDVAARWGGEEFLVVLPETDIQGAALWAERWREDIERHEFEDPDGKKIKITISVGVASYNDDMDNQDVLIDTADKALYRAKETGRNRVVMQGQPNSVGLGEPRELDEDVSDHKPLTSSS
ncbi:MAG: diguanylate cyclase, partial [Deltaproteobacteria bacterium]|nr:diguanylate cyclase [Deltaproteobacteria bacterium]